jgi:ADP-heptose:LPS heptosyltransferase
MHRMRRPATNLAGHTSLGALGALIDGAEAMVCNDTGVSHIAAALRCPSVVVSSGADVARWAPLDAALHRVQWQDMACRPCAHAACPIGHPCAKAVTPAQVMAALALPGSTARPETAPLFEAGAP